jgi:hypothetical protein
MQWYTYKVVENSEGSTLLYCEKGEHFMRINFCLDASQEYTQEDIEKKRRLYENGCRQDEQGFRE